MQLGDIGGKLISVHTYPLNNGSVIMGTLDTIIVLSELPWVPEPKNNKKKKISFPLTNFLSFKFFSFI